MLPLDSGNTVLQQEKAPAAAAAAAADQEGKSRSSLFRRRGSRTCQASKNKKKKKNSEKELLYGKQLLPHCSDHGNQCGKGNCTSSIVTMGTEGTDISSSFTVNGGTHTSGPSENELHLQHDYNCNDDDDDSISSSQNGDNAIYYFGYGTIVNPLVRLRRGCRVPRENIQTAILYDHRLEFIKGGTANIIPCRGWDVKGILMKFNNPEEFHNLHGYDLNYDIRDVSVSPISKTNIDPKNKNDYLAPFQHQDIQEEGGSGSGSGDQEQEQTTPSRDESRGESCPNLGYNDDDSDDEEEYSCPFAMSAALDDARIANMLGGNKETEDPNAIRAVTFMFSPEDEGGLGGRIGRIGGSSRYNRRTSLSSSASSNNSVSFIDDTDTPCVVGMPQERYLNLITDGLRAHEIDEGYINDEILVIPFVKKERDGLLNGNYRTFPLVNGIKDVSKLPKIPYSRYEIKCCRPGLHRSKGSSMMSSVSSRSSSNKQQKEQDLYFIVGRKVMKLIQENENENDNDRTTQTEIINPVTRWIKEACHGRYDISLLVHQTFVDPECRLPLVDSEEDITPQHQAWAEHKLFLYLERGGLTAVQVYELNTDENGGRRPSLVGQRSLSMGNRFSLSMSAMSSIGSRRSAMSAGSRRSANHDSDDGDDRLGNNQLRHLADLPLPSRTRRSSKRSTSEGMSKIKFGIFGSRSSSGTTSSSNTSSSTKKTFGLKGFKRSSF